ncbi:MAG TPA: entericidin A/B family lipoprotein [Burkholderiales bacterium]|nr:entericidin A/B family lipoprotein [Burkholderiales bacterium]
MNLRLSALCVLIVAALGLAGCNTVQGMGRDIEAAGEAIQKSTR